MSSKSLWTLTLLVSLFLSGTSRAQEVVPPGNSCSGPQCLASWIAFPDPGWMILPAVSLDGQAMYPSLCDQCARCMAIVVWSYSGPGSWSFSDGDNHVVGLGAGAGSFRARTHCDAIPVSYRFTDSGGGNFTGELLCPCVL